MSIASTNTTKYIKSSNGEIKVKTDASFGYNLSIKSSDNIEKNALINGSYKLPSIANAISEDTYKVTDNNNVNTWGYIPSKFNSSTNTNIKPGPTDTSESLDKTSNANADTNNTYTIALAAKVDSTLQAGEYKNTFVISAVANSVSYNITYNLESGSWTGTSPQTGSTPENSIALSSVTPTRSNYTFKGWCNNTVTGNGTTSPSCSGTTYQPGGKYPLTNGANTINLYAMWEQNGTKYTINYNLNSGSGGPSPNPQTGTTTDTSITLNSTAPTRSGYEFVTWCTTNPGSSETCSGTSYAPGATYQLSNGAEITLYATWLSFPAPVSKGSLGTMQSFSCSSNLPSIHNYGTVTDSRDNSTYTVAKLKDGKCWMVTNLKLNGSRTLTSSNSDVSSNFTLPASVDSGFTSANVDTTKVHIDSTYGGYYNWYTATAGTGTSSMSSGNATSSICPKGWRLPTGGSGGEFQTMAKFYGNGTDAATSTNLRKTPVPGFVLSGNYSNSSAGNQGSTGGYWSSTANGTRNAYGLTVGSTNVNPNNGGSKYYGRSIRCVAR